MRALWHLFRKNKPADPFARFTETYGMRSAAGGSQASPFGNGYRRAENASGRSSSPSFEEEPHPLKILERESSLATALKTLGVVEAAGAEEISAAYRKLGQPMLVFEADLAGLQAAHRVGLEREITVLPYVFAMFATGHDDANRQAFA